MACLLPSTISLEKWKDVKFWRDLCPFLAISDEKGDQASTSKKSKKKDKKTNRVGKVWDTSKDPVITSSEAESLRVDLKENGYALIDEAKPNPELLRCLRRGVEHLHKEHKYPATCILLFDEAWELATWSNRILGPTTIAANQFQYDILAWRIEGKEGGFSPHRDRQPPNVQDGFDENDEAKFVTHWIALSDATPSNSCLYMIPKPCDPGYLNGDGVEPQEQHKKTDTDSTEKNQPVVDTNPLHRALSRKEDYQRIRCCPRQSGQSLLFTHRIIHWGSSCQDRTLTAEPRIAISFVASDPTFEKPYIDSNKYFRRTQLKEKKEKRDKKELEKAATNGSTDGLPPFRIRLLLVCAQLLIYYQRFNLSKEWIKLCYAVCKEMEGELEDTYRHKVFVEFVKAMKEQQQLQDKIDQTQPAGRPDMNTDGNEDVGVDDDNDDEDEEEAMMEEMLNAEAGGYGEFADDFDEMDEEEEEDQEDIGDSTLEEETEGNPLVERKKDSTNTDMSDLEESTTSAHKKKHSKSKESPRCMKRKACHEESSKKSRRKRE